MKHNCILLFYSRNKKIDKILNNSMSVCPLIIHENDRDLYIKCIYDIVITYGGYMNIESIEDVEIYKENICKCIKFNNK